MEGIVVESTYNWYWLVDGLMGNGYRLHLANPAAIQQYKGLKHIDDEQEAVVSQSFKVRYPSGRIYIPQGRKALARSA